MKKSIIGLIFLGFLLGMIPNPEKAFAVEIYPKPTINYDGVPSGFPHWKLTKSSSVWALYNTFHMIRPSMDNNGDIKICKDADGNSGKITSGMTVRENGVQVCSGDPTKFEIEDLFITINFGEYGSQAWFKRYNDTKCASGTGATSCGTKDEDIQLLKFRSDYQYCEGDAATCFNGPDKNSSNWKNSSESNKLPSGITGYYKIRLEEKDNGTNTSTAGKYVVTSVVGVDGKDTGSGVSSDGLARGIGAWEDQTANSRDNNKLKQILGEDQGKDRIFYLSDLQGGSSSWYGWYIKSLGKTDSDFTGMNLREQAPTSHQDAEMATITQSYFGECVEDNEFGFLEGPLSDIMGADGYKEFFIGLAEESDALTNKLIEANEGKLTANDKKPDNELLKEKLKDPAWDVIPSIEVDKDFYSKFYASNPAIGYPDQHLRKASFYDLYHETQLALTDTWKQDEAHLIAGGIDINKALDSWITGGLIVEDDDGWDAINAATATPAIKAGTVGAGIFSKSPAGQKLTSWTLSKLGKTAFTRTLTTKFNSARTGLKAVTKVIDGKTVTVVEKVATVGSKIKMPPAGAAGIYALVGTALIAGALWGIEKYAKNKNNQYFRKAAEFQLAQYYGTMHVGFHKCAVERAKVEEGGPASFTDEQVRSKIAKAATDTGFTSLTLKEELGFLPFVDTSGDNFSQQADAIMNDWTPNADQDFQCKDVTWSPWTWKNAIDPLNVLCTLSVGFKNIMNYFSSWSGDLLWGTGGESSDVPSDLRTNSPFGEYVPDNTTPTP